MYNIRLFPVTPPFLHPDDIFTVMRQFLGHPKFNERELGRQFQKLLRKKNILFINSGRAAIKLILEVLNFPKNTEVLTPAYTCIVVPNAVSEAGYKVKFVDIDQNTGNMTLPLLKKVASRKTRILILTHMFGHMWDTENITKWARGQDIYIIEDAALALGSTYNKKPAGSFGDASIISFNIGKQITAFGGGLIATDDAKLYHKMLEKLGKSPLRQDGKKFIFKILLYQMIFQPFIYRWALRLIKKFKRFHYYQNPISTDYIEPIEIRKLDSLRLSLIRSQLKRLNSQIHRRIQLYNYYQNELSGINHIHLFQVDKNCVPAASQFSFKITDHEKLTKLIELAEKSGIRIGRVFDYVCPMTAAYKYPQMFPESLAMANAIVNIPFYPDLTYNDQQFIISTLKKIFTKL